MLIILKSVRSATLFGALLFLVSCNKSPVSSVEIELGSGLQSSDTDPRIESRNADFRAAVEEISIRLSGPLDSSGDELVFATVLVNPTKTDICTSALTINNAPVYLFSTSGNLTLSPANSEIGLKSAANLKAHRSASKKTYVASAGSAHVFHTKIQKFFYPYFFSEQGHRVRAYKTGEKLIARATITLFPCFYGDYIAAQNSNAIATIASPYVGPFEPPSKFLD